MIELNNIERFNEWKNRWENPDPMGLLQYISFNIHPEDFLILGHLFFPKFIEIDDCIFFSENYEPNLYKVIRQKRNNDNMAIEKALNQIHIYDLFANCSESIENYKFDNIGKLLALSWSMYLNKEFPSKVIIVDYINNDSNYGPILTVYQQ